MKRIEILYNKRDFPYVRAKLYRGTKSRWYIEYQIYDTGNGELVKKRFYQIPGNTDELKERAAAKEIFQINKLLHDGYVLDTGQGENGDGRYERSPTTRRAFEKAMRLKMEAVGDRSKQNYRNYYNIFSNWIESSNRGGKPIRLFNRNDLVEFRSYLYEDRGNGNRTRNNYLEHIRALLNVMVENGMIKTNPGATIKKLPVESAKNIPFLASEKEKLENYLRKANLELYYFTRFIYYGFMRPVEICRMKINHIDEDRGIILVRSGNAKNARQMPVVVTRSLAKDIAEMKLAQYPGHFHLFSDGLKPGEGQRQRNRLSEYHAKALKACDLYNGELSLYSWKHTGNVNAYLAGVDIKSIQSQNRHHSLEMTEIYLRSLGLRIAKDLKTKDW